ncbi:MAG: hypothetical protein UH625_07165 [Muribaculaceae bacterium]|nr:hypothetical protein [Muribaculaceae bacterium]
MDQATETRRKYVEAWNKTMINIWQERIYKLRVIDSGSLWRSTTQLPVRADGRFYDITLSQNFLEYGLWQDLGVGREVPHGNPGDIGREKKRERRRWFSSKYYSSVLALRDFMADSLGDEFKSMFCAALDTDKAKKGTSFYERKGY